MYTIAACALLWRVCVRSQFIPSPRLRLVWVALALGGYSLIFAYRSGRPDCLALLAACLFAYVHTTQPNRFALPAFFLLGMASPWIGLQLLPWLGVTGFLLAIYLGRPFFPRLGAAWLGAAAGVGLLAWFYLSQGVLGSFLASIRQHTAAGLFDLLLSGRFTHHNVIPKDFSFVPMFLLAVLLAAGQLRTGTFQPRSPLSFGIVKMKFPTIRKLPHMWGNLGIVGNFIFTIKPMEINIHGLQ